MSHRQRNNLPRNVLSVLLASQACRLLADALAADSLVWQAHDVAMHVTVCALLVLLVWMVPYRRVAIKCTLMAWTGFEVMALLEASMNLIFGVVPPAYNIGLQAALMMLLAFWYAVRSYRHASDRLDDFSIFLCRLKPRGFQDIVLAMFGKSALGGVAVYHRGQFWHFQHGVLCKTGLKNPQRYVITNAGIPADSTIKKLEEMIGKKWTLKTNCLTTLLPIIRVGKTLFRTN